jgi:regulator of nucleoside diphosphate kinase
LENNEMSQKQIYITELDLKRLKNLIGEARSGEYRGSVYLERLTGELERASVVPSREIPATVITMNSTVRLIDLESGEPETYTLVYPDDADTAAGKISILAPVGTAMLGYAVGDVFEWEVPAGVRRLKVDAILYQPEAAGDFDL